MEQKDEFLYPRDFPQLHWLFQTYLDGNSCREEYLKAEVKDNQGAFKPLLKKELEVFLKHRPLRHSDYEREYNTDFSSEAALYDYVGLLSQWLYGDDEEPDLLEYLAQ